MKTHHTLLLATTISSLLLTGCGGGGDSSSPASDTTTPVIQTGVLLDSPVINIGYRTETLEGVTNELGEYEYVEGETVTFFIGDLEFPAVRATGIVTPLELADSDDTSDPTVVNIIRLLQTLDENGDPDDGITITEAAKSAATLVDFDLSINDFASSTAVTNLVANSGSTNLALVSQIDAIAHFEATLANNFSIDLSEKRATSVITFSSCPSVPLGWSYAFTDTVMTRTGSDSWQTPDCTTESQETIPLTMTELATDVDIPFNCAAYPICTGSELNKVVSGTDEDDRSFTSTYTFDRTTNTLTYVKSVDDTTLTEVITIQDVSDVPDDVLVPTEATITVRLTLTIERYRQGDYFEKTGDGINTPSGTMQCDLHHQRHVDDTETVTQVWTRYSARPNEVTVVQVEDDEEVTSVLPFDASTSAIVINETLTDVDPTGEPNDIYRSTYEMTGSWSLNPEVESFYREIHTLAWSIGPEESVCDVTNDVEIEVISGSLSAFLY
jgi:hypothetical protein